MTWKFFRLKPGLQGQQSRTGWRALGGGETHAARAPPSARGPSRSPGPPTAHSHEGTRPALTAAVEDAEARTLGHRGETPRGGHGAFQTVGVRAEVPHVRAPRLYTSPEGSRLPRFCVLRPDLAPSRGKQGLERARCPGSGFASRKVATRGCRSLRPVLCYSHFIILLRGIKIQKKEKGELTKKV